MNRETLYVVADIGTGELLAIGDEFKATFSREAADARAHVLASRGRSGHAVFMVKGSREPEQVSRTY
jgi:hypothetical protein